MVHVEAVGASAVFGTVAIAGHTTSSVSNKCTAIGDSIATV